MGRYFLRSTPHTISGRLLEIQYSKLVTISDVNVRELLNSTHARLVCTDSAVVMFSYIRVHKYRREAEDCSILYIILVHSFDALVVAVQCAVIKYPEGVEHLAALQCFC